MDRDRINCGFVLSLKVIIVSSLLIFIAINLFYKEAIGDKIYLDFKEGDAFQYPCAGMSARHAYKEEIDQLKESIKQEFLRARHEIITVNSDDIQFLLEGTIQSFQVINNRNIYLIVEYKLIDYDTDKCERFQTSFSQTRYELREGLKYIIREVAKQTIEKFDELKKVFEEMPSNIHPLVPNIYTPIRVVRQDCIQMPFWGIAVIESSDGQIRISQLRRDDLAGQAGLKEGDIIKNINGYDIKNRIDILDIVEKEGNGVFIPVTIERNNNKISYNIKNNFTRIPEDFEYLLRTIWSKGKVNLAILIGEINNVATDDVYQLKEWKKGVRANLLTTWEKNYLEYFKEEKNFSLVDRQRVEEILKELRFNLTDFVSQEFCSRLGSIIGANYILVIEFTRFEKSGKGYQDEQTRRLIEVETSELKASVITNNNSVNGGEIFNKVSRD